MISFLASKWQVLKVGIPVFQHFYEVKLKASKFKSLGLAYLPKGTSMNDDFQTLYPKISWCLPNNIFGHFGPPTNPKIGHH